MLEPEWRVDHSAHELHYKGRVFPCDRDIEAIEIWEDYALLLSSDTDCLSLWGADGLVRIARVGVYPQAMALRGNQVLVCGGADCRLHQLALPSLQHDFSLLLPGMPERIALGKDAAHVLLFLAEPEPYTQLVSIVPGACTYQLQLRLPGIPGAIAADSTGLWVGVSEQVLHIPENAAAPDITIEGIGLAGHIEIVPGGILVMDALTERSIRIST